MCEFGEFVAYLVVEVVSVAGEGVGAFAFEFDDDGFVDAGVSREHGDAIFSHDDCVAEGVIGVDGSPGVFCSFVSFV